MPVFSVTVSMKALAKKEPVQEVQRLFSGRLPKRRGQGVYSEGSLEQMNLVLQKNILPFMDSRRTDFSSLQSVIESGIAYLKSRIESEDFSSNNTRKEKSILQSWIVFNYNANPKLLELRFSEIRLPELGTDKTEKAKDFERLSESLESISNPRHRLFIKFAYYSGCRVSEMLNARRTGQESRDGKEILFILKGKGNKERILRCSKELYSEIVSAFQSDSKSNRKGYLFWNPKSKTGKFSRQFIYLITKQSGNFSPHQLRHSRGTHLVEQGIAVNEVSEFLGHTSIITTAKYYLHSKVKTESLQKRTL